MSDVDYDVRGGYVVVARTTPMTGDWVPGQPVYDPALVSVQTPRPMFILLDPDRDRACPWRFIPTEHQPAPWRWLGYQAVRR